MTSHLSTLFRLASDKQVRRAGSYPGGTPLQKLICAAPWGRLFVLFGLKRGIHFAHFGLESGLVFEGTTGVHEGILYRFDSK